MHSDERDPWLDSEPREETDEERNAFDPPTPLAPLPKGPSTRKPRTRYRGPNGERIPKRDLRAVENAGAYGPVIAREGATRKVEEFPLATASKACPLTDEQQKEVFTSLREGATQQTAFEQMLIRHELDGLYSFSDFLRWKSDSAAFRNRVDAHMAPGAASLERVMRLHAEGKIVTKKTTRKRVHGQWVEGEWMPVGNGNGIVTETIEEEKELPPNHNAMELLLSAHGRDGFKKKDDGPRGVTVNIIAGNDALLESEDEQIRVFAGKRVIDVGAESSDG